MTFSPAPATYLESAMPVSYLSADRAGFDLVNLTEDEAALFDPTGAGAIELFGVTLFRSIE